MRWFRDRTWLHLGVVELRSGDSEAAASWFRKVVTGAADVGDRYFLWMSFYSVAEWLVALGEPEEAATILGHCDALAEERRYAVAALDAVPVVTLETLAEVLGANRRDELAVEGAAMSTDDLAEWVLVKLDG